MKKILLALFVVAAVIFILDEEPKEKTYTQEEMWEAIDEAERKAYEEGYAYAEYCFRPDLLEAEAERAYEAGYDVGYEDGYADGYDDCKGGNSSYDPDDLPRIKKDK